MFTVWRKRHGADTLGKLRRSDQRRCRVPGPVVSRQCDRYALVILATQPHLSHWLQGFPRWGQVISADIGPHSKHPHCARILTHDFV